MLNKIKFVYIYICHFNNCKYITTKNINNNYILKKQNLNKNSKLLENICIKITKFFGYYVMAINKT